MRKHLLGPESVEMATMKLIFFQEKFRKAKKSWNEIKTCSHEVLEQMIQTRLRSRTFPRLVGKKFRNHGMKSMAF